MRALIERLNLAALSSRERALVLVAAAGFVVFVVTLSGMWFVGRLEEGDRRIEQKKIGMEQVDALAGEYRAAQEQNRQNESRIARNRLNLFTYLDETARRHGISLTSIEEKHASSHKGKASRNDNIQEEMVQVKINKTDMNMLVRFLEDVESREKLVVLRAMTLKRRYDNDKQLDAKLQIATFKKKKG